MLWLNSIGHYERRCVARCLGVKLIEARLCGDDAIKAFIDLGREATDDYEQLRWLLLPQSRMTH